MKNQLFFNSSINIFFLTLILLVFSISSCKLGGEAVDSVKDATAVTTAILERASSEISADASNYGAIMQEAIDKVDDQAIRNQLANARDDANKIVAAGGTEFKCTIQFAADFLNKRIAAIRAKLLKKAIPKEYPAICQVIPASIDMNRSPNQRNEVSVTGYFLMEDISKYQLYHVSSTGVKTDQTISLSTSTDFKLVINLGSSGITLNKNSAKLSLTYDNQLISDIAVIQPQPEPCKIKERTLTGLPKLVIYPEHKAESGLKKGDKEFNGNGPCTKGNVSLFTKSNGRELWAEGFVEMWECPDKLNEIKKDYTFGSKKKRIKLLSVDNGWRIKKIKEETKDAFQNIDRGHSVEKISGSGPVLNYIILGDTKGSDLGSSKVEINFKPLKVTLEEYGDCIRN